MLHVTIALHKCLNGPLTGTGAMEAPGAGASMTLEVDFQLPGQEGTHHMSMPIGTDIESRHIGSPCSFPPYYIPLLHALWRARTLCVSTCLRKSNKTARVVCAGRWMSVSRYVLSELIGPSLSSPNSFASSSLYDSTQASENGQRDLVRFRDSGLRSSAASADAIQVEKLLRSPPDSKEQEQEGAGAEEAVKLRNMDTGEDIALGDIQDRVPPSLDPGEVFRTKDG